ncbi:unnamed protein product [Peniophora sp. CBMAI 1063]|nr:unnamed protein product [Peniophora sp. CBMAI 1063]
MLAQLKSVGVDGCWLVASLGGNDEGSSIVRELEKAGVSTRYSKVWDGFGVPAAWVLHAGDTDSQTVINHNPLPDITHEEFIAALGPVLAPENYPPEMDGTGSPEAPRPSLSSQQPPRSPRSLAPFDWMHFEGRSVKTTLSNIVGLDGLAKERHWRSQCVFSVDVGRRARQGIEALIPHADVLFLNRHYAQTHSPAYARTPRAFLLSLATLAPPHALLVAYWGEDGAAVLSVPTREYYQSSGWVDDAPYMPQPLPGDIEDVESVKSVRSGSDFWAGRRASQATSSSAFFSAGVASPTPGPHMRSLPSDDSHATPARRRNGKGKQRAHDDGDDSDDSQGTEIGAAPSSMPPQPKKAEVLDDVGAQDAFVAGMMYALSRRLVPGAPYAPGLASHSPPNSQDGGRWRLDECLRFATELAGRKARMRGWDGLGEEMSRAGWFES